MTTPELRELLAGPVLEVAPRLLGARLTLASSLSTISPVTVSCE